MYFLYLSLRLVGSFGQINGRGWPKEPQRLKLASQILKEG